MQHIQVPLAYVVTETHEIGCLVFGKRPTPYIDYVVGSTCSAGTTVAVLSHCIVLYTCWSLLYCGRCTCIDFDIWVGAWQQILESGLDSTNDHAPISPLSWNVRFPSPTYDILFRAMHGLSMAVQLWCEAGGVTTYVCKRAPVCAPRLSHGP